MWGVMWGVIGCSGSTRLTGYIHQRQQHQRQAETSRAFHRHAEPISAPGLLDCRSLVMRSCGLIGCNGSTSPCCSSHETVVPCGGSSRMHALGTRASSQTIDCYRHLLQASSAGLPSCRRGGGGRGICYRHHHQRQAETSRAHQRHAKPSQSKASQARHTLEATLHMH